MQLKEKIISIYKKITVFKKVSNDIDLNDNTLFPYFITLFKDIREAYIKNKQSGWEYEIKRYGVNALEKDTAREYLIAQYNEYFSSLGPAYPALIIDESDTKIIKTLRKSYLHPQKKPDHPKKAVVNPTEKTTRWEKIEHLLNENILFKFLYKIWYVISSNATLIRWVYFIGFIFALSIPYLCLAYIAFTFITLYLTVSLIQFIRKNKDPKPSYLLEIKEDKKLLDLAKQYVFNKIKHEKYFSTLREQLTLSIFSAQEPLEGLYLTKINLENYIKNPPLPGNLLPKHCKNTYCLSTSLEKSSIYPYLKTVYPKTQFFASLITNLLQIVLYNYIIAWTISIICSAIKATTLALLISSPPLLGVLILISASIFLTIHFIRYRARENFYQRRIIILLREPHALTFIDSKGELQKLTLEKWQVFEYLKKEIELLQIELDLLLQGNPIPKEIKDTILSLYRHVPSKNSLMKKIKKITYRVLSFLFGIFYGLDLKQQILLSGSILYNITFLPVMIINGITNLLTNHFNEEQRKRLYFAEGLNAHIQNCNATIKKLSGLITLITTLKEKEIDTPVTNTDSAKERHVSIKNLTKTGLHRTSASACNLAIDFSKTNINRHFNLTL